MREAGGYDVSTKQSWCSKLMDVQNDHMPIGYGWMTDSHIRLYGPKTGLGNITFGSRLDLFCDLKQEQKRCVARQRRLQIAVQFWNIDTNLKA